MMNPGVSQPEEEKKAAPWSGGTAAHTPVSFAKRQQGERAVAVWALSFSVLWAFCAGTSPP